MNFGAVLGCGSGVPWEKRRSDDAPAKGVFAGGGTPGRRGPEVAADPPFGSGIVGTRRAKSPRKAIKVPRRQGRPVPLGLNNMFRLTTPQIGIVK